MRKVFGLLVLVSGLASTTAAQQKVATIQQESVVELDTEDISIRQLIKAVEAQTNYRFSFDRNQLNMGIQFRAGAGQQSVRALLARMAAQTPFSYKMIQRSIHLRKDPPKKASNQSQIFRQETVHGIVTDASTGSTLPGVNIIVKGTTIGTSTDADGQYRLTAPSLSDTLVFSFIGYEAQQIPIDGRTELNVGMQPKAISGEELVVTALGMEETQKQLGYSVQEVSGGEVQDVQGVDIGTSLTGKVAGLKIENSTEFFDEPSITLRGETPLLVIDGVPYGNMSLRDISPSDIKSMNVLKGATASALYGARGGSGAIIITTKNGMAGQEGLSVSVNSNAMFFSGYLAIPKAQHAYSSGYSGNYNTDDYVWGAKLDAGNMATQWDPIAQEYREMELQSRGKNNFQNFLRPGYISNNNISVSRSWGEGSIRSSFNYIYKKGQYPNHSLDMFNYSLAGEMKVSDKFSFNGRFSYNKQKAPQIAGTGYGDQGYIYNILVWTGPEYNLSKYQNNYWLEENVRQNWNRTSWYDNPYFMANEKIHGVIENTLNAQLTASYALFKWGELKLRSGMDYYNNENMKRNPPNINATRNWAANGLYWIDRDNGYSINNDLLFSFDKQFGSVSIDGLAGGSIYYYEDKSLEASTKNGLTVPGFYSLNSSVEDPSVSGSTYRKQVNSLFAKATFGYQDKIFLDITGRNDWSSTLPESTRSYFYPSAGLSLVLSEFFSLPQWLNYWKLRSSWAISKDDLGVYELNTTYSTTTGAWNNLNAADFPNSIRGGNIEPETERTYEIGTDARFLQNRLSLNLTYYNKYTYNVQAFANMSSSTGFSSRLINIDETYERRGWEITVGATPVRSRTFNWDVTVNWSTSKQYYASIDSVYSADEYWVQPGKRTDAYTTYDWERDPQGNIIHQNGYPIESDYPSRIGYLNPDWIWGLSNTFRYKNFSLKVSLDGRTGGLIYNSTSANMWHSGSHPGTVNQYRYDEVVNDELTFVGEGVKVVSGSVKRDQYGRIIEDNRTFASNDQVVSYEGYIKDWARGRQSIKDATFFKLRELSLKYNMPQSIIEKLGATKASIALTGQNLLLWTKDFKFADPDVDTDDLNSPSVRYIGINVGLTF